MALSKASKNKITFMRLMLLTIDEYVSLSKKAASRQEFVNRLNSYSPKTKYTLEEVMSSDFASIVNDLLSVTP